jgi:hypothetical protein
MEVSLETNILINLNHSYSNEIYYQIRIAIRSVKDCLWILSPEIGTTNFFKIATLQQEKEVRGNRGHLKSGSFFSTGWICARG